MTGKKLVDLQHAVNVLNGSRPVADVVGELTNIIAFLNSLKAGLEGKEQSPATNTSHYYGGNSFGGDIGAQYRSTYEPMPD